MKMQLIYYPLCNIFTYINRALWSFPVILLIFSVMIYLCVKTRFPQLHPIKLARCFFERGGGESRVRAVSSALAAAMGTGNIIGVASAVAAGGAGAVVWMDIAAFFGMAAAYAENFLGVRYMHDAPAPAYFSKLRGGKYIYRIYTLLCAASACLMGNMIQGSAVCKAGSELTGADIHIVSLFSAGVFGVLLAGGGKRLQSAAGKLIIPASVIYIASSAAVMLVFRDRFASAVHDMISSALGIRAAGGGICGYMLKNAVSAGLRRGIFSNEAGLGSSVLLHTASGCNDPDRVGKWAAFEVFIDTVVCCTLTALVLLVSGADCSGSETAAVTYAFGSALGAFGRLLVPLTLMVFAFASMLGWSCCGRKAVAGLFGDDERTGDIACHLFGALQAVLMYIGGTADNPVLWDAADMVNVLMLAVNLTAVAVVYTKYSRKDDIR